MARHWWDAPIEDGLQWWGAGPEVPWGEIWEPFELLPNDRRYYPAQTGGVVNWLKKRREPRFTREEASKVCRQVGLYDRQHKGYRKYHTPTLLEALEILEVYDYIRSVQVVRTKRSCFLVNPALIAGEPEPVVVSVLSVPPVQLDPRRNFSADQKRDLWLIAGGRCCICRIPLGPNWHADHVIPWSRGGKTELVNGMALCQSCNLEKHARMPEGRR